MEIWVPVLVAIISSLVAFIASERSTRRQMRVLERRLERDYQLEFSAEAVVRRLLSTPTWTLRSFAEIERRLKGLDGDKVRETLIRAGAICFSGSNDEEMWGLIERNEEKLAGEDSS